MENTTQPHQAENPRFARVSRYDGQIVGASLFLNEQELQTLSIELENIETLAYALVESNHGIVLQITGQPTSKYVETVDSITD